LVRWASTLKGCFWASVIDRQRLPTIDFSNVSIDATVQAQGRFKAGRKSVLWAAP
jgi:hypothetical protein